MTKIMLVEDDKSLREIYGVRLLAEGYDIKSAGDGEEALAMAIKEKPDLILADVMMPKISGFDMLDILRSTPETKDIKVIIMTALSSEDQRARGESLGANRYLVKSQVGIEDVVRTVHDLLGDVPVNNTKNDIKPSTPPTPVIANPSMATTTQPPVPQPTTPESTVNPMPTPPPAPVTGPTPNITPTPVTPMPQPTASFSTPMSTPPPINPSPNPVTAPVEIKPETPVPQPTTPESTVNPMPTPPPAPVLQPDSNITTAPETPTLSTQPHQFNPTEHQQITVTPDMSTLIGEEIRKENAQNNNGPFFQA